MKETEVTIKVKIEVFPTGKEPLDMAENMEQKKKHFSRVCHRVGAQSICSLGKLQSNKLDDLVGTMAPAQIWLNSIVRVASFKFASWGTIVLHVTLAILL